MDKRIAKTKREIKKAFALLRREKNLNDITVKEISEKAEINRKTFYCHYKKVSDIVTETESEIIGLLTENKRFVLEKSAPGNAVYFVTALCSAIESESDIMKTVFCSDERYAFKRKIIDLLVEKCKRIGEDNLEDTVAFAVSGIFELLAREYDKPTPDFETLKRKTARMCCGLLNRSDRGNSGMTFDRCLILGCPGSGKSTFARKLSEKTAVPVIYLDRIYWRADKTYLSHEEFDTELEKAMTAERYIMDGNYTRTVEKRLNGCDIVFFMDLPTEDCIEGAKKRIGTVRPDLPWVEESEDPGFFDYIKNFETEQKSEILSILEKHKDIPCIVFKSREEADEFADSL